MSKTVPMYDLVFTKEGDRSHIRLSSDPILVGSATVCKQTSAAWLGTNNDKEKARALKRKMCTRCAAWLERTTAAVLAAPVVKEPKSKPAPKPKTAESKSVGRPKRTDRTPEEEIAHKNHTSTNKRISERTEFWATSDVIDNSREYCLSYFGRAGMAKDKQGMRDVLGMLGLDEYAVKTDKRQLTGYVSGDGM